MRNVGIGFGVVTGLALLNSGCIYPHTSERSPTVTGRIVDAETHEPITGAKVSWLQQSKPAATTDARGGLLLHTTHGTHWMIAGTCATDLPLDHNFRRLSVTREGYNSTNIYASIYAEEKSVPHLVLRDVLLTRQQSAP